MTPTRLSPVIALAIVAVLAFAWIGIDVAEMARARSIAAAPLAVADVAVADQPWRRIDESAYDDVVQRSLFTASRRADFASAAGAGSSVGGLSLRGVIASGTRGVALFESESGDIVRLRRGQRAGRVRVIDIDGDGVLVDVGGRTRRVQMATDVSNEFVDPALPVAPPSPNAYDAPPAPSTAPSYDGPVEIDRTGE